MFPIKNFSDIKSLINLSKKTEAPWAPSGESRGGVRHGYGHNKITRASGANTVNSQGQQPLLAFRTLFGQ